MPSEPDTKSNAEQAALARAREAQELERRQRAELSAARSDLDAVTRESQREKFNTLAKYAGLGLAGFLIGWWLSRRRAA